MKLNTFIDKVKGELVMFELMYRKQHSSDKEACPIERDEDDWVEIFLEWRDLQKNG